MRTQDSSLPVHWIQDGYEYVSGDTKMRRKLNPSNSAFGPLFGEWKGVEERYVRDEK